MIRVPIPRNYGSIERLSNWLKVNMPHEFHVDGGPRWIIFAAHITLSWRIEFTRPSDASLFLLKWS